MGTTSALVRRLIPDAPAFDAEEFMDIAPELPVADDFQHWPPWRLLVVDTVRRVLDHTGGTLVVPMTVLVEQYWHEIGAGRAHHAIPVRHFVFHADQDILRRRTEGPLPLPWSASGTSGPTPRRPARGCAARPRSSTPRTSRLPIGSPRRSKQVA